MRNLILLFAGLITLVSCDDNKHEEYEPSHNITITDRSFEGFKEGSFTFKVDDDEYDVPTTSHKYFDYDDLGDLVVTYCDTAYYPQPWGKQMLATTQWTSENQWTIDNEEYENGGRTYITHFQNYTRITETYHVLEDSMSYDTLVTDEVSNLQFFIAKDSEVE
ncbi:hypothetical protein KMW28_27095 [Flammeovirga yaeyamensis]|uniref:Lipoprotein n=1 Tax=Flammeovirga yaeyamensis TaxID=367791 RepID=A0AAX1NE62_9BACT|nr:hypothetical protein [Flammeovirga yaeyamensis]MBB3700054.1 hypothetical protein [Flammeovirga yaeyamensis]NMF37510.1 hypothetical protein [Flammeovirga yaeyamensis]QWG04567.1 hypothetical protein KMW28_27095 [Flammeovirga yaeyamensis]